MTGTAVTAYAWNGTTWTSQSIPTPANSPEVSIASVSCVNSGACEAVGSYVNASGTQVALAEGSNGKTWHLETVTIPAGTAASVLAGVACTAADVCTAAGGHLSNQQLSETLVEVWSGSAWKIVSSPNPSVPPGSFGSFLVGISCVGDACTAVGYTDNVTLAEAGTATSWTVQSGPSVTGALASGLFGVSCTGVGACQAVGASENQASFTSTLAEGGGA